MKCLARFDDIASVLYSLRVVKSDRTVTLRIKGLSSDSGLSNKTYSTREKYPGGKWSPYKTTLPLNSPR